MNSFFRDVLAAAFDRSAGGQQYRNGRASGRKGFRGFRKGGRY